MIREFGQVGVAAIVVDADPGVDGMRIALGVLDAEVDVEVVAVSEGHGGTAVYAVVVAGAGMTHWGARFELDVGGLRGHWDGGGGG